MTQTAGFQTSRELLENTHYTKCWLEEQVSNGTSFAHAAQRELDRRTTFQIPGCDPRLQGKRVLEGHAFAANGNTHNPTPHYGWLLMVEGQLAGRFDYRRDLVAEARENGAAYLAELAR